MKVEMLKNYASNKWASILEHLAPGLTDALAERGRRKVTCPLPNHGGKGDFRMFRDFNETGGAVCTCGVYSDGFSLLMAYHRWDFKTAMNEVMQYLGVTDGNDASNTNGPDPASLQVQQANLEHKRNLEKQQDRERIARIQAAWKEAFPLTDERALPVLWYLSGRGLPARDVTRFTSLRCHPALPYFDENGDWQGNYPAMLAAFYDATGKPINLHRTYLTPQGAKLPVEDAKKPFSNPSFITLSGGAIRLGKAREVMGVAEGIETALSAFRATRQTVWPCYSATVLEHFMPPEGVRELWIWADHDLSRRGIEAAKALKKRMWQLNIPARILLPPVPIPTGAKGVDWNDVLRDQGINGFPAAQRMVRLSGGAL